jgi:hypothetical protein
LEKNFLEEFAEEIDKVKDVPSKIDKKIKFNTQNIIKKSPKISIKKPSKQ